MEDEAEDACRAVRRVRSHRDLLISIKARQRGFRFLAQIQH